MTAAAGRLAEIHRFPVKSIGGERLDRVRLEPGRTLPGDREWGVLHADSLHHLEGDALTKWLPKSAMLRGAASAALQGVRGGWGEDGRLHLTHPERPPLSLDPARDEAALLDWLAPLWADSGKAPAARLVTAPQPLTDKREPFISLLSLSSLADLEGRLCRPLGTDRWRANLWVDGWEPYAEHDMRLMTLRIGPTTVRVRERIERCAATSADTKAGRLDGDMPAEIEAQFMHRNFGVYVEVLEGGEIAPGDPVEVL
ncbi:MOSC domain-containing protein [Paracoccus sp. S-4012]|uniref:MOSC domain-containing protein n=1 Tax=Paracoccus sp. S-4012 TaxID=2665648 RepID=UPI0012B033CD|nr:MOSC domain-containing protein [Paracoccus sp. S-4012]MRX51455.1 MOSC domain-containing protein [Paracoccus sp. S-4012]